MHIRPCSTLTTSPKSISALVINTKPGVHVQAGPHRYIISLFDLSFAFRFGPGG